MSLLSGRSWPFQWKLAKFHTCNKTHRISSCFRFLSKYFVTALFWHYAGEGWFGSEQVLVFWLRPTDGQRAPGVLPCLQCQVPLKPWHSRRTIWAFLKGWEVGWKTSSFHQILISFHMYLCNWTIQKHSSYFSTQRNAGWESWYCWPHLLYL